MFSISMFEEALDAVWEPTYDWKTAALVGFGMAAVEKILECFCRKELPDATEEVAGECFCPPIETTALEEEEEKVQIEAQQEVEEPLQSQELGKEPVAIQEEVKEPVEALEDDEDSGGDPMEIDGEECTAFGFAQVAAHQENANPFGKPEDNPFKVQNAMPFAVNQVASNLQGKGNPFQDVGSSNPFEDKVKFGDQEKEGKKDAFAFGTPAKEQLKNAFAFGTPAKEQVQVNSFDADEGKGLELVLQSKQTFQAEDWQGSGEDYDDWQEKTLEELIREKPLDQDECIKLLIDVLLELEEIHSSGFVHQGVSERNIVRKGGHFYLTHFGGVRPCGSYAEAPGYGERRPIDFREGEELDTALDVYCLGKVAISVCSRVPSAIRAILERMIDEWSCARPTADELISEIERVAC